MLISIAPNTQQIQRYAQSALGGFETLSQDDAVENAKIELSNLLTYLERLDVTKEAVCESFVSGVGSQIKCIGYNKDPLAVALGRRGGLIGGKARMAKLTPEERTELASNAAKRRWGKLPKYSKWQRKQLDNGKCLQCGAEAAIKKDGSKANLCEKHQAGARARYHQRKQQMNQSGE